MDRIAFATEVTLEKPDIVEPSDDSVFRFPGYHKRIAVNIYRILILQGHCQGLFGDKHGILFPEHLGIMSPDHAVVDRIGHLDVVGGRGEFGIPVEVYAVSLQDAVVIVDSRIFDKVSGISPSVIEPTLTIDH